MKYRAITFWGYQKGEVFEAEYDWETELYYLERGLFEIVPTPYEIISENCTLGVPGSIVKLALPTFQRKTLVEGGHIRAVEK